MFPIWFFVFIIHLLFQSMSIGDYTSRLPHLWMSSPYVYIFTSLTDLLYFDLVHILIESLLSFPTEVRLTTVRNHTDSLTLCHAEMISRGRVGCCPSCARKLNLTFPSFFRATILQYVHRHHEQKHSGEVRLHSFLTKGTFCIRNLIPLIDWHI